MLFIDVHKKINSNEQIKRMATDGRIRLSQQGVSFRNLCRYVLKLLHHIIWQDIRIRLLNVNY